MMVHPTLEQQMAALNLDMTSPPDTGQWQTFLESISRRFEQCDQEKGTLQAGETRLRQIIEHFGDAVYLADTGSNQVHYANSAFEKIYGIDRESLYRDPTSFQPSVYPDDARLVSEKIRQFRHSRQPMEYEHRVLRPNGDVRWVRARVFPVDHEGDGGHLITGITEDITERKQIEATLKEREHFIQQVLNVAPNMVYVLRLADGRNTYINPFMARFYGLSESQIYSSNSNEYFIAATHPDDLPRINAIFENRWANVKDGEVLTLDYRVRNAAGEWRWLHTREVVFSRNPDGSAQHILGVAVDITEQNEAEENLRRSETLLRRIGEHITDTISYIEGENTLYISPSIKRMLGYSPELWLENPISETFRLAHPDDLPILQRAATQLATAHNPVRFEYRCRHADGHYVWLETAINSIEGAESAAILVTRDISERKQMEHALRESQQLLSRINDIAPCMIWVFDLEKNQNIYINPFTAAFFGHSLDELQALGLAFYHQSMHPDDLGRSAQALGQWEGAADDSVFHRAYRMKNARGEYRWLEVTEVVFTRSDEGKVAQVLGIAFEITERKQMEDALRENQERLQAIMDNMPVLLDAADENDLIVFWNRECERVTGYSATEIVGNPDALNLLYPDSAYLKRSLAEAKAAFGNYRNREWTLTCKDGSQRIIVWSNVSTSVPIPGWKGWGVGIDVTDRRRTEEALRQSDAHLRFITENMHDIISYSDLEGRLSFTSASIQNVVGIPSEDWRAMSFDERMSRVHPEDRDRVSQVLSSLRESGQSGRYEQRFLHADGHYVHLETEVTCAMTPTGELGIIYVTRDISERRRTEQALRTSEERLRFITENIDDVVSFSIVNGAQEYTNPAVVKSLGFSPEE
jgi:PAS domain S-box-containing protein